MSEDLTKKLSESGEDRILTAIKDLDERVGKIDERVGKIDERMGKIDCRLKGLEQKVDERLHDTRPIWHKVVEDIGQLQAGQKRLEEGQQAMRMDMSDLNTMVRNVNRDQIVINDVVRRIQLDFHTFDERLHHFLLNRDRQNSST